jgi:predicted glycoside hydrolase/deacetylase ChbG (UPF0249 family)
MTKSNNRRTNRLLGFPPDARLLIVNADDFGMCNSVNEAIIQTLNEGMVRSTTLMVPCPWAHHAMRFLADHPGTPFGIHLTVISDWVDYRWRPVTPRELVPSLVNQAGYFYNFEQMSGFLAQVQMDQLEMDFRAQIEVVLAAGLKPTHLDWHSLRIRDHADIFDLMFGLAREYGLALRVYGQTLTEKLRSQGLPANDYDFLDSYGFDPVTKPAHFARLLRELPVGLSEWAVHPGFDNSELLAIESQGNHVRQADYDFLVSQAAKDIIKEEGIVLIDYRVLQAVWSRKVSI